jgi:hypothetical protein
MKASVADGCKASCEDWYGNARPILLRERVLALLGMSWWRGRWTGWMREVRRARFAPEGGRTTLRE